MVPSTARPAGRLARVCVLLSALLLTACVAAAAASYWQAFSVMWRGEAVGAHRGVALWGHYTRRYRPLSLVHAPSPGGGRIPGFDLAGFHYYQSANLRLIGVPLWLPSGVCLIVLGVAARSWRRQRRRPGCCLVCGYSLTGNVSGVCPECGTPAMQTTTTTTREA